MLKTIALIAMTMIAAILIYAATKPDTFHVQRSTHIAAPAEKVFGLISDLHQWASWSPWEKMDPAMKKSYSGRAPGSGRRARLGRQCRCRHGTHGDRQHNSFIASRDQARFSETV